MATMNLTHASLKQQHRAVRDGMPQSLNLRVHRALSWLARAQACEDADGRFIFLWIAFNAAYAQDMPQHERLSEQENFRQFWRKLHALDEGRLLDGLVWTEFSGPVRVLLDNPYVFESFWEFHRGNLSEADWKARLASGKQAARTLLAQGDTSALLGLVFQRIYTLRNQLMHGGATWGSEVNRSQLRDCVNLMAKLVPVVIAIMMSSPNALWGDAVYPVVQD
jgi:hypothetical protein